MVKNRIYVFSILVRRPYCKKENFRLFRGDLVNGINHCDNMELRPRISLNPSLFGQIPKSKKFPVFL